MDAQGRRFLPLTIGETVPGPAVFLFDILSRQRDFEDAIPAAHIWRLADDAPRLRPLANLPRLFLRFKRPSPKEDGKEAE
jgi:hypothetical protein